MIDLRSDTVTRPTAAMREAMAKAEVGDDVFGDDPTVNALQAEVAGLLGKEAALYFPSGTQCNLAGLMSHCQRGDEFLVGAEAHTYVHEAGGAAVLGSIQPQPLPHEADGSLALERIEKAIKPDDDHYARTKLLSLEQTFGGRVVPLAYLEAATALAKKRGLGTHLDGARLFNATVKLGIAPKELAKHFDSVSVCLSKGLGAPVGSVLVGSKRFIKEAHHWRKMLGGGMRQVGILAAAGRYALQHHVARLAEDHANAARMAATLKSAGYDVEAPQTNILWLRNTKPTLVPALRERGVLATGTTTVRLVTHLDVSAAQCDEAARIIGSLH